MTNKNTPPADPVESAKAMMDRVGNVRGSPIREETIAMLQTVLMVRAIDRLTRAVRANTKANFLAEQQIESQATARQAKKDFGS